MATKKAALPKKIAVFMGAGASKPFGIPLTREILPLILESIENKNLFEPIYITKRDGTRKRSDYSDVTRRKMEQDLKDFLFRLMPGLREKTAQYMAAPANQKAAISFPLITEILSLADHIAVNNNIPFAVQHKIRANAAGLDLPYYRRLLDRAIYEILAEKVDFAGKEEERRDAFANYITELVQGGNEVSLITTNYDTAVEMKIYDANIKEPSEIDFGFSWREVSDEPRVIHQPGRTRLRILKLHGSLNWLKCDLCDHVYINPTGNIIHQSFRNEIGNGNTCDCKNAPLRSLIVAPSFERDVRDSNLLHIWKTALETLRLADEWIMIGYSLPPEDLAIKSLLIRAKNSRENALPKNAVTVVQHGQGAKEAYNLLFGESAFNYLPDGLEEFLRTKPA